jgi:hypothetical protein
MFLGFLKLVTRPLFHLVAECVVGLCMRKKSVLSLAELVQRCSCFISYEKFVFPHYSVGKWEVSDC